MFLHRKFLQHMRHNIIQRSCCSFITHKFYYGQGGQMRFDLTKRSYDIQIETIWEDYCELQINGLKGLKDFIIYEDGGVSYFNDEDLEDLLNDKIEVKLKIPEDYTMNGSIHGNLRHEQSPVGRKLRSMPFSLNILGKGHSLVLGNVQTEKIKINNQSGLTNFAGLTVQQGSIRSNKIESKKIMTSSKLNLDANHISLRSLLMFGDSKGYLKSKLVEIDSVSGYSQIDGQEVKIDRVYAGKQQINIKCLKIREMIGVETGSGSITFPSEEKAKESMELIKIGRMHKGEMKLSGPSIEIL